MTLVEPQERRKTLARDVQAVLDRHQPREYRVSVNIDAIYEEDEWYHVVVTTPQDQRDRDFYDCIAESEAELQEQGSERVYLLVPAIAD